MNIPATIAFTAFAISVSLNALDVSANDHLEPTPKESALQLGTFSTSLAVKDIKASKEFYEKLGFEAAGGNVCLLYTSPSPRDATLSRMPSSA